jgi:hypothetical protein
LPTKFNLLTVIHYIGRLLALPSNFRLVWKWMALASTLAYFDTSKITAVKSFIVQAPGLLISKYRWQ